MNSVENAAAFAACDIKGVDGIYVTSNIDEWRE